MRFDGSSGLKPSAEARRYVYSVMAAIIANDRQNDEGWFMAMDPPFDEFDRRRLKVALEKVRLEMLRKAKT